MEPHAGPVVVESLPAGAVSDDLLREIVLLNRLVWPSEDALEDQIMWRRRDDARDSDVASQTVWHLTREDGELRAMSRTFRRVVATESGRRFPVLALANVCTHPDFRGRGLGRQNVNVALARISADLPVSFFQTPVPVFYERLGARLVPNRIYTSTGTDRAFWEPNAMIFPAATPWPDEAIDLLGRGW